jgi:hypothetical protein
MASAAMKIPKRRGKNAKRQKVKSEKMRNANNEACVGV